MKGGGSCARSPRLRLSFAQRLFRAVCLAVALVSGSLAVGVLGYHHFAGLRWVDALLNASMILSGMGPVDVLPTDAAKIFASCYALYSGLLLLATVSLLIGPFFHRALHRLEVESGRPREPDRAGNLAPPRGDLP
jgi:hypothetical protein